MVSHFKKKSEHCEVCFVDHTTYIISIAVCYSIIECVCVCDSIRLLFYTAKISVESFSLSFSDFNVKLHEEKFLNKKITSSIIINFKYKTNCNNMYKYIKMINYTVVAGNNLVK